MDINNYNYTPEFFGTEERTIAAYNNLSDFGYIKMSLQQWGSNKNKKVIVIDGFLFDGGDICKEYPVMIDDQENYKRQFETAARCYNSIVPESECICLF